MKKSFIIAGCFLLALLSLSFFSCEKDDICAEDTPTTPLLVIDFFDAENLEEDVPKNVTNLKVQGIDALTEFQTDGSTVNTISIPLRTQSGVTSYSFISGYEEDSDNNQTAGNEDIITFNYQANEIFLSRACGYITNYALNNPNGVTVATDTDNWIDPVTGIEIAEFIVENETVTHVKIYH